MINIIPAIMSDSLEEFNYLNFDFDVKLSEIDYKMEPDFKNLTLLLDWHPFSGAFRLTGGFSLNDNTVGVDGTVSKDWQFQRSIASMLISLTLYILKGMSILIVLHPMSVLAGLPDMENPVGG